MPSILARNSAIHFIAARDFVWNGTEYKMGDDFEEEVHTARIDMLVRTRRVVAVVDNHEDLPRHWIHHVWVKEDIKRKLGLIKREDVKVLGGSSAYNKPRQMDLEHPIADHETFTPWEETEDQGAALHAKAHEAALTEQVLRAENEENEPLPEDELEPVGETEPAELVRDEETYEPAEPTVMDPEAEPDDSEEEDEERAITEEDLYDPSQHSVVEVNEYLDSDISEEERERVLAAEEAGKNRKGILS
jgi:hypothetical protein